MTKESKIITKRQAGSVIDDVLKKAKLDILECLESLGGFASEPDCDVCNDTGLWDYTNEHGVAFRNLVCDEPYCHAAQRLSLTGCSLCGRLVTITDTKLCAHCLVDPLEQVA